MPDHRVALTDGQGDFDWWFEKLTSLLHTKGDEATDHKYINEYISPCTYKAMLLV